MYGMSGIRIKLILSKTETKRQFVSIIKTSNDYQAMFFRSVRAAREHTHSRGKFDFKIVLNIGMIVLKIKEVFTL